MSRKELRRTLAFAVLLFAAGCSDPEREVAAAEVVPPAGKSDDTEMEGADGARDGAVVDIYMAELEAEEKEAARLQRKEVAAR